MCWRKRLLRTVEAAGGLPLRRDCPQPAWRYRTRPGQRQPRGCSAQRPRRPDSRA